MLRRSMTAGGEASARCYCTRLGIGCGAEFPLFRGSLNRVRIPTATSCQSGQFREIQENFIALR